MARQSAYGFIWPLEGPKICWDASFLSFNQLPEFINGASQQTFDPSYFDRTLGLFISFDQKMDEMKQSAK